VLAVVVSAAAAARPRFPRSRPSRASAASAVPAAWWAVVGAALTSVRVPGRGGALRLPVLVQALAASS